MSTLAILVIYLTRRKEMSDNTYKTINLRKDWIEDIHRRQWAILPGVTDSKFAMAAMELYLDLVEKGLIIEVRKMAGDPTIKTIGGK